MKINKVITLLLLIFSVIASSSVIGAEIPIPRTMADKGKYYLLELKKNGDIVATLHKRVGVSETGFSKTEINCKTVQYRDMGYSESGPDKIKNVPGRWTDALAGSSKSDLLNFVCTRK